MYLLVLASCLSEIAWHSTAKHIFYSNAYHMYTHTDVMFATHYYLNLFFKYTVSSYMHVRLYKAYPT